MKGIEGGRFYRERGMPAEIDVEEVMLETKSSVAEILQQLKLKIEAGEFDTVLGIDASGRVPALMISKAMQYTCPVTSRFVAVGRQFQSEEYESVLQQLTQHFKSGSLKDHNPQKKILIVDDVLIRGTGLAIVCEALRNVGFSYEIAALTVPIGDDWSFFFGGEQGENFENLQIKLQGEITQGQSTVASIYGKAQMSGVHKGIDTIFSTPLNKPVQLRPNNIPSPRGAKPIPPRTQNTEVLAYTRKRLSEIAEEIARDLGWIKPPSEKKAENAPTASPTE